ncbi:type II secretion system protein [Oceanimonas marisflavi]|uniref:type II secretion system protein n=1 Tax=Oceanimonas marisflavi TaxID=2059724 RepID=UPI000D2FC69E|nr:type II secretion system protein [Oceanimonas marisflavi]
MKARGFTLLELVIVMVLIGISVAFGSRFIAQMADSYMGTADRAQALAGARFSLERLRRELAVAYGPSVYISDSNRCLSFVPALAAGTYRRSAKARKAIFMVPLSLQGAEIKNANMAIRADSGEAAWQHYPSSLSADVQKLLDQTEAPASLTFEQALGSDATGFRHNGLGNGNRRRYTLIKDEQVRFCTENGSLYRQVNSGSGWSDKVLMLTGLADDQVFLNYDHATQLLTMEFVLDTRDGELVLPGQLQVTYAP